MATTNSQSHYSYADNMNMYNMYHPKKRKHATLGHAQSQSPGSDVMLSFGRPVREINSEGKGRGFREQLAASRRRSARWQKSREIFREP